MAEEPKSGNDWSRLSNIGFEFVAAVGGFTLVGYLWDGHFGTSPWGTLTGVVLGLAGATYNMVRRMQTVTRSSGRESKRSNSDGQR